MSNKFNDPVTLTVTAEEAFVIKMALEQFADIRDGEYRRVADIASTLWGKVPDSGLKWADVASR